ncbi:MAG: carboxypeptidase-like regulatory domain-containing protein, partial [Planctomycetota bacterium]
MNVSSVRTTLSAFLLALLVAACVGPEPFREGVRGNDQLALQDDVLLTRVVDDLTGAPLIGAEVFLVDESRTPIGGEFWYSVRAVSDAEGFVRIALPTGATSFGWQVVRHRECGVATRTGTELVWRVGRGFDVPVRITDWLGRPQPGARIGFCGGCGHTPDLVSAVADSNGIAVLRGVDPQNGIADLYVQHPGLHYFYEPVEWLPGGVPMDVRCLHAPTMSGRVVDHRGAPVAGAFVCGGSQHRGPWARTAADGSFTVLGAKPPTYPHLVVLPQGRDVYFGTSTAWPVTLRLPDLAEAEAHEGVVEQLAKDPQPLAMREVRVAVEGAPAALELGTVVPGHEPDREPAADHVFVPERGPFELVVSAAGPKDPSERRFPFLDATAVREPLVVQWTPAVRLRGRAVDPAEQPVAVGVRVRKHWFGGDEHYEREEIAPLACAGGEFDLPCVHTGTVLLELAPAAAGVRPRLLWVDVPAPGTSECVELGAVVVGGEPQLRVVDADGAPAPA